MIEHGNHRLSYTPRAQETLCIPFASNFAALDSHIQHLRGKDNLKTFTQAKTIASGHSMTNHFCSTCGTLLYRKSSGFPEYSFMRIGTVDDFDLHETKLRPTIEQFTERRVNWLEPVKGVKQCIGQFAFGESN